MPDSFTPRLDAAVGRNRDRFEFELDTENCPSSGTNNSEKGVNPFKSSQGCRGIGRQFDTDGFFVLEK